MKSPFTVFDVSSHLDGPRVFLIECSERYEFDCVVHGSDDTEIQLSMRRNKHI